MTIRLVVRHRSAPSGPNKSLEVVLDGTEAILGRDKSCQVVLSEQAVSRSHARISREGNLSFLEDLGSAYGTSVNGRRLPEHEKRLLQNGDVIAIAQFDLLFENVPDFSAASEKTAFVARQIVKDVLHGLGGAGPFFRVMNGEKEGQRIEIRDAKEIIVGRDPKCDLVLVDDLISRRHVKIRRDWAGTHVEDLKSRNGIKVNRKRTRHRTLRDKDELQIGSIRLLFIDPSELKEPTGDLPLVEPAPSAEPVSTVEPVAVAAVPAVPAQPEPVPAAAVANPQGAPQPPQDELEEDDESEDEEEIAEISNRSKLFAVAAMAVFGLVALAIIVAVLVGA